MTSRCTRCNGELKFDDGVRGKNGGLIPLNPDGTRHDCPAKQIASQTSHTTPQPQNSEASRQDRIDAAVQAKLDRLDRIGNLLEQQTYVLTRIAQALEVVAQSKV